MITRRATRQPNKGMKLTERIGALQLVPGVRPTEGAERASRRNGCSRAALTAAWLESVS
jgi:hypothetical protein